MLNAAIAAELAVAVVALCWVGFGLIVVLGKKEAEKTSEREDRGSHLGFLLQCAGYALCFIFVRGFFSPLVTMATPTADSVAVFTAVLAVASTWFCFAAARALGRQWALVARVIADHQLIRHGPYALVRNPIYLAMFGMLVATGLAVSRWQVIPLASAIFLAGSVIRIRSEERLLRDALGPAFDAYARQVPAFLPGLF